MAITKQKTLIRVYLVDHPRILRPSTTSSTTESTISASILCITAASAALLQLIPYEQTGRYRVPKIIFNGQQPSVFHAFIVSIMFAFSGAFSTLFVQNKPNMVRLCRYYSMVSMASAVALLMCAGSWKA